MMFRILTQAWLVIAGGFIVWFVYRVIADHCNTIDIPFKGEDRFKAFVRRAVIPKD